MEDSGQWSVDQWLVKTKTGNRQRSTDHWPPTTDHCLKVALFGIVKGGMDMILGKKSAERTVEISSPATPSAD